MPAASSGWFLFLSIPIRFRIPISICLPPLLLTHSLTHTRENSTLLLCFLSPPRTIFVSQLSCYFFFCFYFWSEHLVLAVLICFPPLSASCSPPCLPFLLCILIMPPKQLNKLLEKPVDGDSCAFSFLCFPVRRLLSSLCQFFRTFFFITAGLKRRNAYLCMIFKLRVFCIKTCSKKY